MKGGVWAGILLLLSSFASSKRYWFLETFDSDFKSRWILSKHSKFDGKFKWDEKGEKLVLPEQKMNYGMICKIEPNVDNEGKTLVLQYEVKFSKRVECGGAYIKLIFEDAFEEKDYDQFSDESLFAIMFGPDRCRYNEKKDKVHFIFNHFNEICETWEEKHYERPPRIINDDKTHLYTLKIRPDNTFEIFIDQKESKRGSLFNQFHPSVIPPMYFKKNDPRLTKPRNIENKCYYEPETPYKFRKIGWVGIDIYTGYSSNISIDNILVTWDEEYADILAKHTWARTNQIENYERPFHYSDDFNVVFDGPEVLEFEKDFDYDEL